MGHLDDQQASLKLEGEVLWRVHRVATERHEESMYFGFLVAYKQKNTQSIVMRKEAPSVRDTITEVLPLAITLC
jgi:hypothetical protein